MNGTKSLAYYQNNARMVPEGLQPVCHKMHITIQNKYQAKTKGKAQAPKNTNTLPFQPAGRKKAPVKKDGFLAPEELEYWSSNYKVEETVPSVPTSTFVTLKNKASFASCRYYIYNVFTKGSLYIF